MDKITLLSKILLSLIIILSLACAIILIKYANKLAVSEATLKEVQKRYNSLTEEYERIRKTYETLIDEQDTNLQ